jgi:cobalamin biosynthesis Mg chelatase CobN
MDVGTHDDKAAAAARAEKAVTPVEAEETPVGETRPSSRRATATATKPGRPQTAAEIVAAHKAAREKAAEEAAGQKPAADTAMTKPVTRQPAVPSTGSPSTGSPSTGSQATGSQATGSQATGSLTGSKAPAGNPPASAKSARENKGSHGKSKAAMSAVGSGVARLRNMIASLVWLVAVLAAVVLALGALFTALDQTNQTNEIVTWILARGHELVGPFKDLFRLETAKNTLLVNWGIAALVYLIAGKIVERFIRP